MHRIVGGKSLRFLKRPGTVDNKAGAAAILRGLIDEVRLIPKDGDLAIHLVGNLAAVLELGAKKDPGASAAVAQITLVAGARKQRESLILPVHL